MKFTALLHRLTLGAGTYLRFYSNEDVRLDIPRV